MCRRAATIRHCSSDRPHTQATKGFCRCCCAVCRCYCWRCMRLQGFAGQSAASQQEQSTYTLKLPVDEVSLTLQVLDDEGRAVYDLKIEDLKLLDNGIRVRRIVALESIKDAPVRVGILLDSSESMERTGSAARVLRSRLCTVLVRQPADRGFVMDFAGLSPVAQEWTSDVRTLEAAIRNHQVASHAQGLCAARLCLTRSIVPVSMNSDMLKVR